MRPFGNAVGTKPNELTATTAVTFAVEQRCYNQPAFFSISTYLSGLAPGYWLIPEGRLPARY